jgi:hypothetical protein
MVDVEDPLQVTRKPVYDTRVTSKEYHAYYPYPSAGFGTGMEIRIPIHHQDLYTLPHTSRLVLEGKLVKDPAADGTDGNKFNDDIHQLTTNGYAHLFAQIRYELNGVVVDQVTDPGIATTLKGLASFEAGSAESGAAGGFLDTKDTWNVLTGAFWASIPLSNLLGIFEDFKKILINIRQELVLLRANNNNNALYSSDRTFGISIEKIYWLMEHVSVDDKTRLALTDVLKNDPWLELNFMSWELHTYPTLLQTKRHTWTVKTAPQLETPRYVIVAFQTDRRNNKEKSNSGFDGVGIETVRLFLNGVPFPYNVPQLALKKGQWVFAYQMFCDFQKAYYEKLVSRPLVSPRYFYQHYPMFIINCSSQPETVKTGSVDVRLEWETLENIPAKTSAYCLILHERRVQYKPLTSAVQVS